MAKSNSRELPLPWLHIGDCPVCGDGLCRVRCCSAPDGHKHLFALCDECETIWLAPSTSSPRLVPDPVDPRCPITGQPLFGEACRWATIDDIRGTVWESETIVDIPADLPASSELSDSGRSSPNCDPQDAEWQPAGGDGSLLITGDDVASALDVPAITPIEPRPASPDPPQVEDWAYGQDEPRPGC